MAQNATKSQHTPITAWPSTKGDENRGRPSRICLVRHPSRSNTRPSLPQELEPEVASVFRAHFDALGEPRVPDEPGEPTRGVVSYWWHHLELTAGRALFEQWDATRAERYLVKAVAIFDEMDSALPGPVNFGGKSGDSHRRPFLDLSLPSNSAEALENSRTDDALLTRALAAYLVDPELADDNLDWLFVNALLVSRIRWTLWGTGTGELSGGPRWAFIFAGGRPNRAALLRLAWIILKIVAALSMLVGALFALESQRASLATWLLSFLALYILGEVSVLPEPAGATVSWRA